MDGQPAEEEKERRDGTSTMPESLRNHGFGSDRQGVLIDSNSNDEVWAKQQED